MAKMKLTKASKASKVPKINIARKIEDMFTPPGFIRQTYDGHAYPDTGGKVKHATGAGIEPSARCTTLTSKHITICINYRDKAVDNYILADGHVQYYDPTNDCWFTFDRLGINDSFSISSDDLDTKLELTVAQQLLRVEKRLKELAEQGPLISVPGTPFRIPEKRRIQIQESLLKGRIEQLAPSGMGSGLQLTTRPFVSWAESRTDLAKFFGVPKVFVTSFDHD